MGFAGFLLALIATGSPTSASVSPAPAGTDLAVGVVEEFLFSPDGRTLLVLGSTGVALVDPGSFSVLRRIEKRVPSNRVLFSSDGNRVAIAPCDAHLIALGKKGDPVVMKCDEKDPKICVGALIFSPATSDDVWVSCSNGTMTRRAAIDGKVLADATSLPGPLVQELFSERDAPRLVPAFTNGLASGVKIFSIAPEGPWSRAGFKPGDVIMAVDDILTVDPSALKSGFENAALTSKTKKLNVRVLRHGKPAQVSVAVP